MHGMMLPGSHYQLQDVQAENHGMFFKICTNYNMMSNLLLRLVKIILPLAKSAPTLSNIVSPITGLPE